MPRERVVRVGVLNIKTQPHSAQKYLDLLDLTYTQSQPAKIRGSDWGMIGTCRKTHPGEEESLLLHGTVYRFLNIDPRGDWLNLLKRTPISAKEEDEVPLIPEYLKPNLKQIPYIFFPEKHRFFFDLSKISPKGMKALLDRLFSTDLIQEKIGQVDIEVESTKELIQKILNIPRITKLKIDFSFPNPDDLSGSGMKVMRRFKKQNIRRHKQESSSTHDDGIKADDETKALMDVALSNGKVEAVGYDGERKIELSTVDHPLSSSMRYNPEIQSQYEAMLMASTKVLRSLR